MEGDIPNVISHTELFVTMKMKNNFCNGNKYEIQKSQDGGGNKAYKTFMSWVVEGNILNTISHIELFITIGMKNNFCSKNQHEMQKSQMEEEIRPIKSLQTRWRSGTIQAQYPMWNCSWLPLKWKNNFCNGRQYEMQKSRDWGGYNAYTIFMSRVVERNIPNTISHMELFMATMKVKSNFCDGYQYKMQKNCDEGGSNAFKTFTSRVEEEKYHIQTKYLVCSCL